VNALKRNRIRHAGDLYQCIERNYGNNLVEWKSYAACILMNVAIPDGLLYEIDLCFRKTAPFLNIRLKLSTDPAQPSRCEDRLSRNLP
jgi:hypothetical protein